jgi:hypothetical protein
VRLQFLLYDLSAKNKNPDFGFCFFKSLETNRRKPPPDKELQVAGQWQLLTVPLRHKSDLRPPAFIVGQNRMSRLFDRIFLC